MILEDQRLADQRSPKREQLPDWPPKRKLDFLSDEEYRLRKDRTDGLVEGLRRVRERAPPTGKGMPALLEEHNATEALRRASTFGPTEGRGSSAPTEGLGSSAVFSWEDLDYHHSEWPSGELGQNISGDPETGEESSSSELTERYTPTSPPPTRITPDGAEWQSGSRRRREQTALPRDHNETEKGRDGECEPMPIPSGPERACDEGENQAGGNKAVPDYLEPPPPILGTNKDESGDSDDDRSGFLARGAAGGDQSFLEGKKEG
jgi:hypothetical protein